MIRNNSNGINDIVYVVVGLWLYPNGYVYNHLDVTL